jgi:hypothetical protein
MILVYFVKVIVLHPQVVILSLTEQLEKPHFCYSYTSFGVWLRDHYMPLQKSTTRLYHGLLRFSEQMASLGVLRFPPTKDPSCIMWVRRFTKYAINYDVIPHSIEQNTLPIVFLISKQDVPYQTHGGTYCPEVSTTKIRSLPYLSTTCHNDINHLHHYNHCSNHNIDSHHGQLTFRRMEDHNTLTKTQAGLNITKDRRFIRHS